MIDTAENEIRALRHQRLDRQHHAIGRRAVYLVPPLSALDWSDRVMECQRMTGRALFSVGRDDGYLAERPGSFDQARQTVCKNSIVIGTEQPQRLKIPALCRQRTLITSQASRNSRK